jgi:hypothetical protein
MGVLSSINPPGRDQHGLAEPIGRLPAAHFNEQSHVSETLMLPPEETPAP